MAVVLGAVFSAVVFSLAVFFLSYRGFVNEIWAEVRYATWSEMRDDARFAWYNIDNFQRLRLDPDTGMYDFAAAARELESSRDGLEAGKMSFHLGEFSQAIARIERDIQSRGESEERLFWLALSYQRQAELEGCLAHLREEAPEQHSTGWQPDTAHRFHQRICTLPASPVVEAAGSMETAARLYQRLLDERDPDNDLYRWLLNFSYMALGRFPDGVPDRYLIQSDFIDSFYGGRYDDTASRFSHLGFQERARELGVDVYDAGKGVAVEDFDADGFLDLVTGGSFSTLRFFKNDRGLRFLDKTEDVGLGGVIQPFILTAADYDNDGWMDLFVGRPYHVFSLFRNLGGGVFADVTHSSGLLEGYRPGQSVFTFASAWADIDNDGNLDLFLAQLGRKLPLAKGLLGQDPTSSRLFLNQDGRFIDATARYGIARLVDDRIFPGAAFGDYDNDGWQDLFLSSFTRGRSVLLRNAEGRRFEPTELVFTRDPGFMTSFIDINHDGLLDLFQGSNAPARSIVRNVVMNAGSERYTNKFYLQGDEGFTMRSDLFGDMHVSTMGASYGDINNDGCHDFYLGTGNSEPAFVMPNLMYVGQREGTHCTGRMTNISMLFGFGTIQKGHGIVFFDFDNDGDQDIYSSLGGMWPADSWPNQLFVNESQAGNSWVKIRLRGRRSNRFGVGATIRVVARNDRGQEIIRTEQIGTKTGFGSAPHLAHIGLLTANAIERIEVTWPGAKSPRVYCADLGVLIVLDENEGMAQGCGPNDPHGLSDSGVEAF